MTPAVWAAVDDSGKFPTNVVDPSAGNQLSEAQAIQLAVVFASSYAIHARSGLELGRGAPIRFEKLAPCGRALYAATPYRPEVGAPTHVRNSISPRWFIALCADGEPQLSVSVAALATELRIRGRIIEFPREYGNEFFAEGIPANWEGALAIGPESAAILAARVTTGRVVKVPRLFIVDPGWTPQAAQWRIELDDIKGPLPASVRDVFVGLRLDGVPALRDQAVVVQTAVSQTPSWQHLQEQNLRHLKTDSRLSLGWKTAFAPVK